MKKEKSSGNSAAAGKPKHRKRYRLKPATKGKIVRVAGIVVGVFAVFTFAAILSYLFTWKTDQSLLSEPRMLDRDVDVTNIAGKIGFRWADFLVGRCFGLASFSLVVMLAVWTCKLIRPQKSVAVGRLTLLSLSSALLLSWILAYAGELFNARGLFSGGLGGDAGAAFIQSVVNLIGLIVTGLCLLVLATVWLLFASGRFSAWFAPKPEADGDGTGKDAEEAKLIETQTETETDTDAGADSDTDAEDSYAAGLDSADGFDYGSPGIDGGVDEDADTAATELVDSRSGSQSSGNGAGDGQSVPAPAEDGKFSVETDEKTLTGEVRELPRIDVRDELSNYRFPTLDLLDDYANGQNDVSQAELEENNMRIRNTLLNFKIKVDSVTAKVGPTVTLYKVYPAPGVRSSAIKNLSSDIARSLNARGVRVIDLSDSVGIEVANKNASIVPLKKMLNDPSFRNNKYELPIAIGYTTITQTVQTFDLADAPHLIVAGATKQGKSVCLNVIITSLLYAKHPSELKFVFIDPKMVEFTTYESLLKHYIAEIPDAASEADERKRAIVKDPKHAEQILGSLCVEMDERFELLSKSGENNIKDYNEKYRNRHLNPDAGHRYLPYIVAVVDEFADLLSTGVGPESKATARSINTYIKRLAQKGRAAGIHMIIATQRPSVGVITGEIKTNFPYRIAFRVVSRTDSQTILDNIGAESLIGKGDMLFYTGVQTVRVQCAMIGMSEIKRVTDFISAQTGYKQCYGSPYYLPSPPSPDGSPTEPGSIDMTVIDPMFEDAARMVVSNQKGSTSDLQRRLGMGYARAGRVMDQLEAAGVVGPQDGSRPRQVLVADFFELEPIIEAFCHRK